MNRNLRPDSLAQSRPPLRWAAVAEAERWPAMVEIAQQAVATAPNIAANWNSLVDAQLACGRWTDASHTVLRALTVLPDDARLLRTRERIDARMRYSGANSHSAAKGVNPGQELGSSAVDGGIGPTERAYRRAIALARANDPEAAAIIAPDRDMVLTQLPIPEGFADNAAFHNAIIGEIGAARKIDPELARIATRDGIQTEPLWPARGTALAALTALIRNAVDRLFDRCGARPLQADAQLSLIAWAVTYASASYQISHIHPDGWLSGVYCVETTPDPDPRLMLGSLESGPDAALAHPWPIVPVDLRPGDLVLFPSFLPHAVRPSRHLHRRVVIAFDVIPVMAVTDAA